MSNSVQLAQEAAFFDRQAEKHARDLSPLSQQVVDRYRHPRGLYSKEFAFKLLGDPRGQRILDVGCGEGEDAALLGRLGAEVTGIDVSPGAIALARKRAVLNGVADRVSFICSGVGETLPERSFDVIWIDNLLHHVLDDLDAALRPLLLAAKPGARLIAIEPVNLNKTLRKIRFLVPVHTEVTPGERPLEKHDLAALRRHVPDLSWRHFNCFGRLLRFVLPDRQYERAALWRKALCDLLMVTDRAILSVPGLAPLGGMAVLHGRLHGARPEPTPQTSRD